MGVRHRLPSGERLIANAVLVVLAMCCTYLLWFVRSDVVVLLLNVGSFSALWTALLAERRFLQR